MDSQHRFVGGAFPAENQGYIGEFYGWSSRFHCHTYSEPVLLVFGSEVCVDHGGIVLDCFGWTGRNLAAEI